MISHVLLMQNEMITNNYSYSHQAIDLVGEGHSISDVIAYDDGTVVYVVNDVKSRNTNTTGNATYGNFVKIKHENNIQTLYAHMKYGSVKVKVGDKVEKGDIIGTMGDTGRAFGIHLHFEVMDYANKRKNPYDYLWKTNSSPVFVKNEIKEDTMKNEIEEDKTEEVLDKTEAINENDKNEEFVTEEVTENTNQNVEDEIIENIPENKDFTLFENSSYKNSSLADALNEIFVNNTYEYREKLAFRNGIKEYTGTEKQNLKLLSMLQDGSLKAVY